MRRLIVAAIVALGTVGMFAVPAHAAATPTTFTLTAAGGLSVSAPSASVSLGSVATNAGTVSAQLGAVTVDDQRGALNGSWTASVISTDFTTGAASASETIAATNVDYWSGASTATTGTAVLTPGQATALTAVAIDTAQTAFAAASTVGNNSATWNPTVVVNIPSAAVVGTYSGTVTHSVA